MGEPVLERPADGVVAISSEPHFNGLCTLVPAKPIFGKQYQVYFGMIPAMNDTSQSKYWLDQVVAAALEANPKGDIVVSSGHSPSGNYHIGTIRETMTAAAITQAIALAAPKRTVRHIDFVDDFDALRKIPAGLPEAMSQYLGQPLYLVPSPDGQGSYGDFYLKPLYSALEQCGVVPEIIHGYEYYQSGEMTEMIETALSKQDQIREIYAVVGGREVSADWSPVQLLSDAGSLREWYFTGWDQQRQVVLWKDAEGKTGELDYTGGRVKLDWRLDWPARWAKLGVTVEPFGRDHATKGGSYDTGAAFVKEIFGGRAPLAVPYEFILPAGANKKFSKSAGGVITPAQVLEVMPAEVLRYFILRSRPAKTLYFDTGLGLYSLLDEFTEVQEALSNGRDHDFAAAYRVATAASTEKAIASVPFNHLVTAYQSARRNPEETIAILKRSGWKPANAAEQRVLVQEMQFVDHWLDQYAPDSVKFSLQEQLPIIAPSAAEMTFLATLADAIELAENPDGLAMHQLVYEATQKAALKPQEGFRTLYQLLLSKDSGPKAGWFLASLDKPWLVSRLRAGAKGSNGAAKQTKTTVLAVQLPDGRSLSVDPAIIKAFPDTQVGYLVANLKVQVSAGDVALFQELRDHLDERQIDLELLAKLPEVQVWREAYRGFGAKASDYKSSLEALLRRVLTDKPWAVNSVVDGYNQISVKHLVPMGAMDLDHVKGDIALRYGREGESAQLLGMDKAVAVTPAQVVYADERQIISWLWNHRDAAGTGVSLATKQAIFFIDSQTGRQPVEAALAELVDWLEQSGGQVLAQGILPGL